MNKSTIFALWGLLVFVLLGPSGNAYAYIGPGAGFAFLSSFLILFISFALALFYLFTWPLRLALKGLLRKKTYGKGKSQTDRMILVGFDGLDPKLTEQYMKEGLLPNLSKLREDGTFAPLSTTYPSISPVAWSSFMTGMDASYHNIFDFITRDPCTYMPMLSSAEIGKASKILPIGKYRIPLGKPKMRLLRKSRPFWKILGENGIFSSILRVPITFPPEKFHGHLLSGMCTPDLKGSQGTFTFYTTNVQDKRGKTGGVNRHVVQDGDTIKTYLYGPENTLVEGGDELTVPMTITIDPEKNRARIEVCGQKFELAPENYSPWIKIVFRPGLGVKIHGICRFYINRISPDFELYVSPIHIDPEKPVLPISHPFIYSIYLAKLIGPYGTLGLAEDTWALNERVIDEDAFLKQAYLFHEEREKMFFEVLEKTPRGLCTCVFDITDRVQHMFFRHLDGDHPANRGKEVERYSHVIRDLYVRMDELVGRILQKVGQKTVLIIMSDHGFTQFKRGVNLNTWLFQNNYLSLKDGRKTSGDWLQDVDWERTKAFSLGLAGMFINRKGREVCGIVDEGEELRSLKRELIKKLTGVLDEDTGEVAILTMMDTETIFSGPYIQDAPDLLIGYNHGYRSSWDCVTGRVTNSVFEDNTRHWSGDHCVAPELVPGVLFMNRKINTRNPKITDIAPTVLKLFGVDIPAYMKGKPLIETIEGDGAIETEMKEKSHREEKQPIKAETR